MQDVGAWMPAHVGEALAVAHFLDQMYSERPARQMEASPWYEAAGSLARKLLHQRLRPAPKVGATCFVCLQVLGSAQQVVELYQCGNPAALQPSHWPPMQLGTQ